MNTSCYSAVPSNLQPTLSYTHPISSVVKADYLEASIHDYGVHFVFLQETCKSRQQILMTYSARNIIASSCCQDAQTRRRTLGYDI